MLSRLAISEPLASQHLSMASKSLSRILLEQSAVGGTPPQS